MILIALILAAVIVFLVQADWYKKHAFDNLDYKVTLSTSEVFEDEEIFLYEEITNNKFLPLPFLKVDTELPDGLAFHILEDDRKTGRRKDTYPRIIHSVFVMKGHEMIRRRWRVKCDVRGTYHLGNATLLADNIFGSQHTAKVIEADRETAAQIVVLPKAVDLTKEFTCSRYTNGEFLVQSSLLSDPLLRAGVRDYTPGDPMNRINWTQTAVRNHLMVNIEEHTNRHQFNIVLNMQARDIEKQIPGPPSSRTTVELCLTVIASILDSVSGENIPVRIISNTPPELYGDDLSGAFDPDDEIGSKIFVSPEFKGKLNMITALRFLAQMELMISTPIEKMLDHILEHPYAYTSGGNMVFVSSFLSERMINFAYALRKVGVNVIFYITSASINASIIPDDIEVHFKTFVEE